MAEASQITCPHCGQSYAVQPQQWAQYHGQTINCTKCGKPFTVTAPPQVGGSPAMPPQPQPQQPQPPAQMTPPAQPVAFQQPPPMYPPPPNMGYAPASGAPPMPYGNYQTQSFQAAPTEKNGWALTSLLTAFVPLIGGVVAIVTGIVALTKTRDPRVRGKGMAVAGISLGGINLLITPILLLMISILLPALNRAREQANRIKCASNMKQIGLAIAMYSNNEKGQAFPPDLKTLFDTQDLTAAVFVCPSSNDTPAPGTTKSAIEASLLAPGHMSYVYVGDALNAAASPDTVVLYENPADHLNEGMNVLFADFHVEWVSKTEMQSILNQKAAGKKVIVDPSP